MGFSQTRLTPFELFNLCSSHLLRPQALTHLQEFIQLQSLVSGKTVHQTFFRALDLFAFAFLPRRDQSQSGLFHFESLNGAIFLLPHRALRMSLIPLRILLSRCKLIPQKLLFLFRICLHPHW